MGPRDPRPVTVRTIRLTISKRPEAQAPKGARDIVVLTQVEAARDQRRLRAPAPQSLSGA